MTTRHRAAPMRPEMRRRAILDAVVPLLLERGASVTTAEMADAAGVAEGTLYSVFDDKLTLIHEAVRSVMDPEPARRELAEIPTDLDMRSQLSSATTVLLERFTRMMALGQMLRTLPPPSDESLHSGHSYVVESNAVVNAAVSEVLARHQNVLGLEPARAAVALGGLIFAGAHPLIGPEDRLTTDEIVTVLLTGITTADIPHHGQNTGEST